MGLAPSSNTILFFESEEIACTLVAGLPFALRAVQRLTGENAGDTRLSVVLAAPGGWSRGEALREQIHRLFPNAGLAFEASGSLAGQRGTEALALLAVDGRAESRDLDALADDASQRPKGASRKVLRQKSRALIARTGKPGDGYVSRYLNRPISQWITFHALKLGWTRPNHATFAAGLIGLAMAACLFFGGVGGLIAGAILFQCASVVDGVDGEMARASVRSSKFGASLDAITDAATNLAFLAGVSWQLWADGETLAASLGMAASMMFGVGLALVGGRSWRETGAINFDLLKNDTRTQSSRLMTALGRITSRDAYALFLAIFVATGFAKLAIFVFAFIAAIWLAIAILMLLTRG